MSTVFPPSPTVTAPVARSESRFPVHRIYCVGRNYSEHVQEMGYGSGEPPVFFLKPADALLPVASGETGQLPYPSLTHDLHHEVELVVAIGGGGADIRAEAAMRHVFGYAVGLDMTRRDLQAQMKKRAAPWCIGKAFEHSAPIGPITPVASAGEIRAAEISLAVNGAPRQHGRIEQMVWDVPQIIAALSQAWTLQPGDLIYTGTPAGVGPVHRGDVMEARISGLEPLRVSVT